MQRIFAIILFIFPVLLQADEIRIISSIKPISDIVSAITKKDVNYLIASKNNSIHHYSLKPSDIKAINNSDIVFLINFDFEYYMQRITQNLSSNTKIIELSKIDSLKLLKDKYTNNIDYHIWLDTDNSLKIAKYIAEMLSLINPLNEVYYQENLLIFENNIKNLDKILESKLHKIENSAFIVEHDGYLYLEKKYHLKNIGSLGSGHDSNLTINQFTNLKRLIDKYNVQCLFTDKHHHSPVIDKLKTQTNIKSKDLDAEWGEDESSENSYIILMHKIADDMLNCFI